MSEMWHVLPVNDARIHDEHSASCHCNPRVESDENGTIVIHNAFDGREMLEEGADLRDGATPS